jgi:prolipoprotein diacylglyceryltransferase
VEALKIVLLCLAAAVVYGICQDQITARVCVEYFTVGHLRIFETEDPTLLAFGWGILATWWVGLLLGVPAALVARAGRRPRLAARELLRPIGLLMLSMACFAAISGVVGYVLAGAWPGYDRQLFDKLGAATYPRFMADAWAHGAAYLGGLIGGIVLMAWMWQERNRRSEG